MTRPRDEDIRSVTAADLSAGSITVETLRGENPKQRYGSAKPNFAVIPSTALVQMAVVHDLGARKYGPYNWRETKVEALTYVAAAERHLRSWLDGEDIDPESGASHLAHAMACCAILIDAKECGSLDDNRPPLAPTAELIQRLTREIAK